MKKFFALILSAVMLLSLVACGNQTNADTPSDSPYNKLNLKISVNTGEAGIDFMTAQKFADLVKEASDGVIQATVYGNGQLQGGDMSKSIETLLAGGTFEMCVVSLVRSMKSFSLANSPLSSPPMKKPTSTSSAPVERIMSNWRPARA